MKTRIALLLATLAAACADTNDDTHTTGWTPDLTQTVVVELGNNLSEVHAEAVRHAVDYINERTCFPTFTVTTGPENDEADRVYLYVDRDAKLAPTTPVQVDVTDRNCYVHIDRYGRAEAAATGILACLGFKQPVVDGEVRNEVFDALKAAHGTERCGLEVR